MKKILILISAFAMSTTVFAMPNVGDTATFAFSSTNAGQTQTGTVEMQLMSQDTTSNMWSEQVTTVAGGQTSVQTQQVPGTSLMSDDQAQAILTNCVAASGTLQSITVPAGTFNACALPASDASTGTTGTVWVGMVTFGIVQEQINYSTGQQVEMQLQSDVAGQ